MADPWANPPLIARHSAIQKATACVEQFWDPAVRKASPRRGDERSRPAPENARGPGPVAARGL